MFFLLLALAFPAQADDSPEAAVAAFYSAYGAGNLQQSMQYWEPGDHAATFAKKAQRLFHTRCISLDRIEAGKPVIDGKKAIIDVDASLTLTSDAPGARPRYDNHLSTFELVHDGRWKIRRWTHREAALVERVAALSSAAERRALIANAGSLRTPRLADQLSGFAIRLSNSGKNGEAREALALALDVALETGDLAAIATARGVEGVLLLIEHDHPRGIEITEQAVMLAEQAGDPDVLARMFVRLGRAQFWLRKTVVRPPFERVMALSDYLSDVSTIAHAASQLAFGGAEANDRRGQLHYGLIALRYAEINGENPSLYNAHFALGEAYALLGYTNLAIRHYEKLREVSERAGWPDGVSHSLLKIAQIHRRARREKEAVDAIERALPGADREVRGHLLMLRGMVALDRLDLESAETDFREGLRALGDAKDSDRVSASSELVDLRLRQGRFADALELSKELVRTAATMSLREQLTAVFAMVKSLRKRKRFDEAREQLAEMFRRVEALHATATVDETHWSAFYSERALFDREAVALAVDRGDAAEALRAANAMKARALRAFIERRAQLPSRLLNDEERGRAKALNGRIVALNKQLVGVSLNADATARLQAEIANARLDLDALHAKAVAARSQSLPMPSAIEDPLAYAPSNAVVQYVSTDEGIIVIGVAPGQGSERRITAARIAITRHELSKKVDHLLQLMESRDLGHAKAAREMFDLLLEPVRTLLTSGQMLCVIPDEDLWRVPFQALLAPDGRYVAATTTLYYAPSLALADLARSPATRSPSEGAPSLLAFANPQLNATTVAQYRSAFAGEAVGDLPDAETEVREVARMYGASRSRVYIGEKATEWRIKSESGRVSVIHFATHGAVDSASPLASAMLLAPGTSSEDGLLEAREILDLHVESDLAVLSACSTGAGRTFTAEGVMGLTWAFLAGGCPTIVASQWRAASAVTSRLMIDFHRHLRKGHSAAEALQKTQKKMLADPRYRHPYYWAPFVVVGAQ